MSAPSYDTLSAWVENFDDVLNLARNYDSVEVALTFEQPWVALLPGVGFIRTLVAYDARSTWARATEARSRLGAAHAWLAQSRDSVGALGDGVETWQKAAGQSQETLAEMTRIVAQNRDWSGAGAEQQEVVVAGQVRAQTGLTKATTLLGRGCLSTQNLMSQLFAGVAMDLLSALLPALGAAMRAPSAGAGLFGLNSRMKAVASALERAAARYEAVRGGEGWSEHAASIANFFAEQCDVQEARRRESHRAVLA